jgi:hypothetical protein
MIIYLIIEQVQIFFELKMKYFRRFCSYIDIGIIVCSLTSVGIFIWKYEESKHLDNLLNETNGYIYVNFENVVYVDDLLTNLIGFVCYSVLIKSIHFGRFSR